MLQVKRFFGEQKDASAGTNQLTTGLLPEGILKRVEIGNQTSTSDVYAVYFLKKGAGKKATRLIPQVLNMPALEYVSWDGDIKIEGGFIVNAELQNCTAGDIIELTVMVEV